MFGTGIRTVDTFCEDKSIAKGISDHKLPKSTGLCLQRRTHRIGRRILLV